MRHLLARLIERLPLETRERRAVDETLADWEHEASIARTRAARAAVAATGLFAVCAALARPTSRTMIRWATLSAGVLTIVFLGIFGTVAIRWSGNLEAFMVTVVLGGILMAAMRFAFGRDRSQTALFDPFARDTFATDAINYAHVRVAGVGGAGLVAAAMIAALEFQLTTVAVALGLSGGIIGATTVILIRRWRHS